MTNPPVAAQTTPRQARLIRWGIGLGVAAALVVLWVSNIYLTASFTQTQRAQAELRAALYAGNLKSTLERFAVVPTLLARDATLITALSTGDYISTSQRLQGFQEETGAASVFLMDLTGNIVAASDRRMLGESRSDSEFFSQLLRTQGTLFSAVTDPASGTTRFYYGQKVELLGSIMGAIVVEVGLNRAEDLWRRSNVRVSMADAQGTVLISSDLGWRSQNLTSIIETARRPTTAQRVFGLLQQIPLSELVYIDGERFMVSEATLGFRGWKLSYFAPMDGVDARVNAVIALEIMFMAIAAAALFYIASRRATRESRRSHRESAELRALNARLSAEVEQRIRAERSLQSAEQSLEQAAKLAALGQLSAAVSHELNQPLAAMRTYLAGARLLVKRNRTEEALSSMQRIDDLTERMGNITKQLRSHARKAGDVAVLVDLRNCVTDALAIMSPRLGKQTVTLVQNLPDSPAYVLGDSQRIGQVIVNLISNALDAVAKVTEPRIAVTLELGETISLRIEDNGYGIEDPESVFEPFYTTKQPGEGVGLGLAISAGIATEMGGRLIARNGVPLGAVFELQLPRADGAKKAAE